jgi:hypothetical protein
MEYQFVNVYTFQEEVENPLLEEIVLYRAQYSHNTELPPQEVGGCSACVGLAIFRKGSRFFLARGRTSGETFADSLIPLRLSVKSQGLRWKNAQDYVSNAHHISHACNGLAKV